jgi:hexokinase
MITESFVEPVGSSMKFAGKLPHTAPMVIISEAGVFDSAIGGTMFFKTIFPTEQRISHIQFQTLFTLSQTVSMISIT